MSQSPHAQAVDHWTAIAAASMLIGVNQLIINVQPLLLGALARNNGLTDTQLGLISSALIGGAALASLTAPVWVRSADWRAASTALIAGAVLALIAAMHVDRFAPLCAIFFLIGVFKGGIGAPSFAALGDTANPERNFGTSVAVQAALAALAAVPMAAWLIPAYGASGVYVSLIAALMLSLGAVLFLPRSGRVRPVAEHGGKVALSTALLPFAAIMGGLMLFTIGVTGFWFFLERIGSAKHIPDTTIGLAVSGTALISIPGSFAVTWLSRWLKGLHFALLGSALIALGYGLVALPGALAFLAGSLIFAFGWGVAQPGYWALARETDPTARLFVLSPAIAGIASVITGIVSGPVIVAFGYGGLLACASTAIATGALLAVLGFRASRTPAQA